MAEKRYYWLKLPVDFFESKRIKKLRKLAGGDTYTIIYLKMQLKALENGGYLLHEGVLDDFVDEIALDINEEPDDVSKTIHYLEKSGLARYVSEVCCRIYRATEPRNRTSSDYKAWRTAVFQRDNYTCRKCGLRGVRLNAHHVKPWASHRELRYDVDNGVTLCEACHKAMHRMG